MYWAFEKIHDYDDERISDQLVHLFSKPHMGIGWLAFKETEAVGYLLAVYVFSLEHLGVTAEIDEFFVLQKYRNLGIGKRLLEVAETEFIRVGCTNISLQIAHENDAARSFYHKHGYLERTRFELLEKTL